MHVHALSRPKLGDFQWRDADEVINDSQSCRSLANSRIGGIGPAQIILQPRLLVGTSKLRKGTEPQLRSFSRGLPGRFQFDRPLPQFGTHIAKMIGESSLARAYYLKNQNWGAK